MNRRKKKCKKFLILMEKSQLKSVGANYLGYYYFSFLFLYYALSAMDHQYHILYKYSNSLHIFCYYLHIFFSFEFVKTNYRQNFLIGEQRECPRYFKLIIYPEAFPLWRTRDAPITSPLLKRHVSKSITVRVLLLVHPTLSWRGVVPLVTTTWNLASSKTTITFKKRTTHQAFESFALYIRWISLWLAFSEGQLNSSQNKYFSSLLW